MRRYDRQVNRLHSSEAERAVLGACLMSKDALASAIGILKPDDFYDLGNKSAFEVLVSMFSADKPVDYVTFGDELRGRGVFDRLGGQSFINGLMENVSTTANVEYHADIVRNYSIRRKLITSCDEITLLACDYDKNLASIPGEAEKLIFDAAEQKLVRVPAIHEVIGPVFASILERARGQAPMISGYATGFTDLDSYTGGLQPGSLNIIAARPSMGKTAFALNIAQFGGGEANDPVLIFSLEMPADHLVQRMVAAQSGVDLSKMKRGLLTVGDFDNISAACDVLAKRNIFINDATQLSALGFRAKCRAFKMRHPDLALVIVDYLQLMTSGEERSAWSRQQEVSDISRMLKTVARELACPVIALSQLSRAAEQRTDKKPQLSDLRDSGAIEQDADLVMMLYREDYYSENENNALKDSRADIRIAKNRNGSTGMFSLTFKREITRFLNFGEV